jgi:hypothetical protein
MNNMEIEKVEVTKLLGVTLVCSSLLNVAVISLAVVADVYRHTGFTQSQWDVISKH